MPLRHRPEIVDKGYIRNRISMLQAERRGVEKQLALSTGVQALQYRAHLVVLERRLMWYKGRLGTASPVLLPKRERTRRRLLNRKGLVEGLERAGEARTLPHPRHRTGGVPRPFVNGDFLGDLP